jgi:hypothetical protein
MLALTHSPSLPLHPSRGAILYVREQPIRDLRHGCGGAQDQVSRPPKKRFDPREIREHLAPLCRVPSIRVRGSRPQPHHNLVFGHREHDSIVERHLDLLFRASGEEEQLSIRDPSEQRLDRISAPAPPNGRPLRRTKLEPAR